MSHTFTEDYRDFTKRVKPSGKFLEFELRVRGTSRDEFMRIKNSLMDKMLVREKVSKDLIYNVGKSKFISSLEFNGGVWDATYREKKVLGSRIYSDGVYKTSLSEEIPISQEDFERSKGTGEGYRREKKRWSWNLSEVARVDLTEVGDVYEVEFEFLNSSKVFESGLKEFQKDVEDTLLDFNRGETIELYQNWKPVRDSNKFTTEPLSNVNEGVLEVHSGVGILYTLQPTAIFKTVKESFIDSLLLASSRRYQESGYTQRLLTLNSLVKATPEEGYESLLSEELMLKIVTLDGADVREWSPKTLDSDVILLYKTPQRGWRSLSFRESETGLYKTIFEELATSGSS
jgi:hypothetical protein